MAAADVEVATGTFARAGPAEITARTIDKAKTTERMLKTVRPTSRGTLMKIDKPASPKS